MIYPIEREKSEADAFIGQTAFLTTYSTLYYQILTPEQFEAAAGS